MVSHIAIRVILLILFNSYQMNAELVLDLM